MMKHPQWMINRAIKTKSNNFVAHQFAATKIESIEFFFFFFKKKQKSIFLKLLVLDKNQKMLIF